MSNTTAETLTNQGAKLLQTGDNAGAIAAFDAALQANPKLARALASRGRAYHRLGRSKLAIADLDQAIALEPAEPIWFAWRAIVRLAQWEFDEALADADAAIHRSPNTWEYHLLRGHARYHLRDAGMVNDYRTAFDLDPVAMPRRMVEELSAEVLRNSAAVLRVCEQHQRTHPNDYQNTARRGLTRLLMWDDAAAETDFQTCRTLDESANYRLEAYIAEAKRKRETMPGPGSMYSHG